MLAASQLVEDHAEREYVGGGGHRLAADLLGRGIGRRHQVRGGEREVVAAVEQLGDAEVEQMRPALGIDQQVRRLQIAMHDQRLVRRLHRFADARDQRHAFAQRQAPRVAVARRRLPVDQRHRVPGHALVADAAVDQRHDVRVRQARQDCALAFEAPPRQRAVDTAADQLQRHLLLETASDAAGAEHGAHAAFAEHRIEPERADAPADPRVARVGRARRRRRALIDRRGLGIEREQAQHRRAQVGIVAAFALDAIGTRLSIEIEQFAEQFERAAGARVRIGGAHRRRGFNRRHRDRPGSSPAPPASRGTQCAR